ncbi:MAG TPA: isocitrate lyase/PEP mutase family protein [Solirubrobacteraceae bacterium]|jgi:2-methylisocitrate lyase-like PEP mutase family enzyme
MSAQAATSPGRRLRDALQSDTPVIAPGAFNPLLARLIERAGFPAIYAGGSGISSVVYGRPDMGLSTMTEIRDVVRNIAGAVSIPVLGDIDQGFGDLLAVSRSVREFEAAGLGGVHLEDEAGASKHAQGSTPIPVERFCEKLQVALEARTDPDFMLFARSDALRPEGMKATIDRCRAYVDAGADGLWVFTGLSGTPDELTEIAEAFPDVPLIYDWTVRGIEARAHLDEIRAMGYRLVIVPNLFLFAQVAQADRMLREIQEQGSIAHLLGEVAPVPLVDEVVGLEAARAFQRQHSAPTYVSDAGGKHWTFGDHATAGKES